MENKVEEESQFKFKLSGIVTTKFEFNSPIKPHENKIGISNYIIDPKIGFNVDINQAFVILNITGKIIATDEIFFNGICHFIFSLENFKNIAQLKDGVVVFNDKMKEDNIVVSLIGVSYSTARGIIMEKGAGTILQFDFLPVVNPIVFLKKRDTEPIK